MKCSRLLALLLLLGLALGGGWYCGNRDEMTTADAATRTPAVAKEGATSSVGASVNPSADKAPKVEQVGDVGQAWLKVTAWSKPKPNLAPLAPEETYASRQVLAVGEVHDLPSLKEVKQGQRLPLLSHRGMMLTGVVNLVQHDDLGWTRVGGKLEGAAQGSFSLSQKGSQWRGTISHVATRTAYVLETQDNGRVRIIEKPLGSVICEAVPRRKAPSGDGAVRAEAATTNTTSSSSTASVTVPELDSLPLATHVIYLDFDGEDVSDPDWNNGFLIHAVPTKLGSSYISEEQITDVWKRVVEDFKLYNISVTTKLDRYNAAGAGQRMRCIITETDAAAPNAGGVAYTDSYNEAGSTFSSTIPCWAFTSSYYNTDDIAGTISHEVGHTLGLSHDGKYPDTSSSHIEYYAGHGSGVTSWGPIMGTTYDRKVSQWSKGEYSYASNPEDDLAIIAGSANGFGYQSDDVGNSSAAAVNLPNLGTVSGLISSRTDLDVYTFGTTGGTVTIEATSAEVGPNLDILLELRGSDGITVLTSANPSGPIKTIITQTVPTGTYYVVVRSGSYGTASTGYTTYGSIGEYSLSASFPAIPPDSLPVIAAQPESRTVTLGTAVTFKVQALSNQVPTYQWTKDNVNLAGQTKDTLVIASAQPGHQGDYRCVVTNINGSTTSDPATLVVNYKPMITQQPVGQTLLAGTPVTFNIAAHGTSTVLYQWQRNGVNIPSANDVSYTLNDPQWADAGSFRCLVSNGFGVTTSSTVKLVVQSAPVIVTQPPATFLAPLNGSTSFSLSAVGTATLTYQWYKGVDKLVGKTSRVLSLTGITPATAGTYHCEVKNALGTTLSQDCAVTVQDAPVITRDPAGITIARGAKTVLSVVAVGAPALKYVWRKDGVVVGSNSSKLTVVGTTDADYQVTVSNNFNNTLNTATSAIAHVTVHDAPKITVQPLSQIKAYDGSVDFIVTATGTPPLSYAWTKNKVPIPGANAATLSLSSLVAGDAASYAVIVTNDVGRAVSTSAKLTLQTVPSITDQPDDQSVYAFATATLTVRAAGSATLKYQWQKNSVDILGATSSTYKIINAQAVNEAEYRVLVKNTVGSVLSDPANLTVVPVAAPSVGMFMPSIGKVGHYVKIQGTNLNWTTSVSFSGSTAAPVKAAFVIVSPQELLVTVPAGAITSNITVNTRGGVAQTAAVFQVVTANNCNDDFANARVIPGAGGKFSGSNSTCIYESGEPSHALPPGAPFASDYLPTYSAWFQWVPAVSGNYFLNTKGSYFDTRIAIYQGSSVNSLTPLGYNDDEDYDNNIFTSKAYVYVTAGNTYHIAIDGFFYLFGPSDVYDERGTYVLSVTKSSAGAPLASAAKEAWMMQGDSVVDAEGTVRLGGEAATESQLAWLSVAQSASDTAISCRATLRYEAPAGSKDLLGISAYNTASQPMFGLSVAAETGELSLLDASGQATTTGQCLVSGQPYEVELRLDPVTKGWGALLNGIWIAQDQPLAELGSFADFAAQWTPQGNGPHSSLTLESAQISSESAVDGK